MEKIYERVFAPFIFIINHLYKKPRELKKSHLVIQMGNRI